LRSYATASSALIAPLKIPHSWGVGEELFVFFLNNLDAWLKKRKHLSTEEHMLEVKSREQGMGR
jgi:hypothetical protein